MLSNPKDFIDHYVSILKKDYNFNDLKINYHGFVGFVMNLFAWTNYDLKQYYDHLFKEGFLATSEENKNLYLHASRYGYSIAYATPSTAYGTFTVDMSNFPRRLGGVYKREVTLPTPLIIKIGGYTFQTDTTYKFIEEGLTGQEKYYCQITSPNDRQRLVSSASPTIKVPIYNLKQYEITNYSKVIPEYDYGSYFPYSIVITSPNQINNLIVRVKVVGDSSYEEYNVSRVKTFDTSISKSVYLIQKSDKLYIIETGNGYHGVWISGAMMDIDVYTTKGSLANSLNRQGGTATGEMHVVGYTSNGDVVTSSVGDQPFSATNFIIDCQNVEGGVDIPNDSELKNDIIRWVESRNNLINETDFFNVFESYIKDFDVTFKKSQFIDNNFYLCRALRDQYKNILYTTNHTYKCSDYQNPNLVKNISISVLDNYTSSVHTIGRCYYKIVVVDKFYKSVPSSSITATIVTIGQAISITWDVVPEADYYKVFGRTNEYDYYWIVDKDHIDIDGKVYFIDIGDSTCRTLENCGSRYEPVDQVNFPEFEIDLSETVDLTDSYYTWVLYSSTTGSVTYYINNKDFKFTPESITILRNSALVTLTKIITPRLDQLVTDSWVIIDSKLYICLSSDFNPSVNTITLKFDKSVVFTSPFVYKYNSFFDWFEGYFLYDNIVQYPIISDFADGFSPPISHLNIVFDKTNNETTVYLRSYQTINDNYTFSIKIDGLNVDYTNIIHDEAQDLYYYQFDGFLVTDTTISVNCYSLTEAPTGLQFSAVTLPFRQTYEIRDQLLLIKYIAEDNRTYISNIPLLSYERPTALSTEYEDPDYINTQIFNFTANSNINSNRIMSDSVQTRFLNTIFCESYLTDKVLLQTYSTNIILPLNIEVNIKYKTSNVDFSKTYSDIELLIAEYLQTNSTGVNIKYYNSQIIDLIHKYNSDIISVSVNVYDSYGTSLNDGIEVKPTDQLLPSITDKLSIVKFTKIYWWWNLNNIRITQNV